MGIHSIEIQPVSKKDRAAPVERIPAGKLPFKYSATCLVIVNLFPLVCVLAFRWSIAPIMFLYWVENIVIGFFNVLKMRKAQGPVSANILVDGRPVRENDRRSIITFFIMGYSGFTLAHGLFIVILFGLAVGSFLQVLLAFTLFFFSHYQSYRKHFVKNEEFRRTSFDRLFFQPYKRIVVMHLTILAGCYLVKMLDAPILALAVMIFLKTAIDLVSHVIEHRKFSRPETVSQILIGPTTA